MSASSNRKKAINAFQNKNPKGGTQKRTLKKLVHDQFKEKIEHDAEYHDEAAMKWSDKQNWGALKDAFESIKREANGKRNGRFVFPTVQAFALYKADGDEEIERWIRKSIGPTPREEIKWQGDWALMRAFERVKDSHLAITLEEKLGDERGLFKITAPVAASYRRWMEEPDKIRKAVVDYLEGTIIEPKPDNWKRMTAKAQRRWRAKQDARLNFYFDWTGKILEYKHKVDNFYLDTLGFNKPNMMTTVNNLVFNRKDGKPLPTGDSNEDMRQLNGYKLLQGLSALEMEKARIFDVPLPDEYSDLLKDNTIDTDAREVHEDEEPEHAGKAKKNGKG